MLLSGKKIALLLENIYEDNEFWYPYFRLTEEGAQVDIVAPELKTYNSKHGAPANATVTATDALTRDYDGLIIPGGFSPDMMRRSQAMVDLVKKVHSENKPVAAICHGPWMLVSAGALKGKKATCFFSLRDDLINAGAEYVDVEVVQDGNIITSRMPKDLPAFLRTIISALR